MKIVSTNIAKPTLIEWRGQKVETGIYKYAVDRPIFLGKEDVADDHVIDRRYHGGSDKACYLYSADQYPFWKSKYPNQDWRWGMFGENLTIDGLNESEIRIGDRFQVGEAVVQVTQPRQPCFKLGVRFGDQQVVSDFWMASYPGVYVRVLSEGEVKTGDELIRVESNRESLTVAQVFSVFHQDRENIELMLRAIAEPFIAASCRRDIENLIGKRQ